MSSPVAPVYGEGVSVADSSKRPAGVRGAKGVCLEGAQGEVATCCIRRSVTSVAHHTSQPECAHLGTRKVAAAVEALEPAIRILGAAAVRDATTRREGTVGRRGIGLDTNKDSTQVSTCSQIKPEDPAYRVHLERKL